MLKMERRIELTAKEKKLHDEACAFARQHQEAEHGLCRVLRDIDQNRLYRKFGYARLFYYAVKEVGLTEAVANMTITVARKTAMIAELRRVVDEGKLSVSKASRITSGITTENASEVIAFAQTHTSNEIDAEMARRNPGKPRRDSNRPIGNDKVEIRAQISTATNKKLKRAESLLASKGKATTLDSVLDTSLELFLDHHDPVRKAHRARARAAKKAEQNATQAERKTTGPERKPKQAQSQHSNQSVSTSHQSEKLVQVSSSGKTMNTIIEGKNKGTVEANTTPQSREFCLNRTTHTTPQDQSPSLADASINAVSLGEALLGDAIGDLSIRAVSLGDSSLEKMGGKPYLKTGDKLPTKPGGKPSKPTLSQHDDTTGVAREREHIIAKTNHAVMLRTGGQCDFVNERGERCTEDRYLHIHHIVPLSQGGSDDLSNLACLCSGHHALVHQLALAIDGQFTWLRSPKVEYQAWTDNSHG